MSKTGKVLIYLFVALLILALVAGSGVYLFVRRSFPTINGALQVPGLHQPVTVIRDRWGVPHLYAENNHDLFFAQGYVHAQDRLWQMEFNRRLGRGALSEVLGQKALDRDEFMRTIGLSRAAQKDWETLDGETRQVIQDYADGVNAFIESHRDRLPIEFTLLGSEPAAWQPTDSLVWSKVMCLDMSRHWLIEKLRAQLVARLDVNKAQELLPPQPALGPLIVPAPASSDATPGSLSPASDSSFLAWSADAPGLGSNNWVIDGSQTASGKPLLANDPHMGVQLPSTWYEMGLHGGDFNVAGATFPGAPGVVIGHNDRIAWGITNLPADVQDLYLEKLNPDNPHQYEFMGQWEDMEIVREEIKVKGRPTVELKVRITRHGPLIDQVELIRGLDQPTALRWTALDAMTLPSSVLNLNRAQDWQSFREALRDWDVPGQNFVYADVDGNIGYQATGKIPIRAQGDGTLPPPGWTGEYEWIGYVPFDELPYIYNPPAHLIVTANNKVAPDEYPYLISSHWDPGYRAQRITDLLTAQMAAGPLTADDLSNVQADVYSLPGEFLAPYILEVTPENELQERALEQVRRWDYVADADSPGAAIAEVFGQELVQAIFADELGETLLEEYNRQPWYQSCAIKTILQDPNAPWLDDVTTPVVETRQQIVQRAFDETVSYLRERLGNGPEKWAWGQLHTVTFKHSPLGQSGIGLLERLVNRGPFPAGGSGYTVNNAGYNDKFEQGVAACYRQIVDLSDWNNSRSQHTTGQSGQPMHEHYADMLQAWRAVKYHPMLFDREQIEAEQEGILILRPAN